MGPQQILIFGQMAAIYKMAAITWKLTLPLLCPLLRYNDDLGVYTHIYWGKECNETIFLTWELSAIFKLKMAVIFALFLMILLYIGN